MERVVVHRKNLTSIVNDHIVTEDVVRTIYIKPASGLKLKELELSISQSLEGDLLNIIRKSETGGVIVWTLDKSLLIVPPFPISEDKSFEKLEITPLNGLLFEDVTVGVILLRLGRYSVGVFCGEELLTHKSGTRYVKGKNRAGGSSQRRFERIRLKQIREIYDKTCEVARGQLSSFEGRLDYLLLGGEKLTIRRFVDRCGYIKRFEDIKLSRLLLVDKPGLKPLEKMPNQIWSSQVHVFK